MLVSIGSDIDKEELLDSIKMLSENGFNLYGTSGNIKYYSSLNLSVCPLENKRIYKDIKKGFFGLVINISIPNKLKSNLNEWVLY